MKVFEQLDDWVARGWLSRLNRSFAGFLATLAPSSSPAVLWAGALLSHQLDRGEVDLDLDRLQERPGETLAIPGEEANDWERDEAAPELAALLALLREGRAELEQSKLIGKGPGDTPLVLDGSRLYLRRYWHYRQSVRAQIERRVGPSGSIQLDSIGPLAGTLFAAPVPETPNWQKIACFLALRARLTLITGGPGTGKTTTLSKLLALFVTLWPEPGQLPRVLLAAPTGKAAARVSEAIASAIDRLPVSEAVKQAMPKQAVTLHRLLGSQRDTRAFRHNRHHPLLADLVVVDEASMIDLEMMAALLDALPETTPLILLGDKDQLASVEAGAVLGELCQGAEHAAYDAATRAWIADHAGVALAPTGKTGSALNQQTVLLRHSHRFGEHSGIGHLAQAVNRGDSAAALAILQDATRYPDLTPEERVATPSPQAANRSLKRLALTGYGQYRDLLQAPAPGDQAERNRWAASVLQAFDRFRVLSPLRQGDFGVAALNARVQQWLFPDTGLWYPGRPVIVTRNDYTLGLMNGDIGIALSANDGALRVAFFDAQRGIRWLSPMRLQEVETAFALTVHKAQGSEFDHVALVLPPRKSPVISRALIYTAITRAKTRFTLLEASAEAVFAKALVEASR